MSDVSSKPAANNTGRFPWHPVTAIGVLLAIYYGSQFLGGLVVSLYPMLRHWGEAQAHDWAAQSVVGQFCFIALVEALTLGLLYVFLRRYKRGFRTLGLTTPKLRDAGYALAGLAVYFFSYIVLVTVVTKLILSLNVTQEQQIGFDSAKGVAELVLVALSLVVLPPLVEEILMRGFLYGSLRSRVPKFVAAIITSIIFAAAHLQAGSGAPLLWIAALDTFVLSLVLCHLKEKTGRLWAGIGVHAMKNGIAFVSLFILHVR